MYTYQLHTKNVNSMYYKHVLIKKSIKRIVEPKQVSQPVYHPQLLLCHPYHLKSPSGIIFSDLQVLLPEALNHETLVL